MSRTKLISVMGSAGRLVLACAFVFSQGTLVVVAAWLPFSVEVHAQTIGDGSLKVTSFPTGANVSVDGTDSGKVTPMTISLSVGDHIVVVSIPNSGWNADTRTVTIVSGNNDLSVTLLPTLTTGPQGPPGAPGAQGPSGPAGSPGATGPQGPPGVNNRGAWSNTATYNASDAVYDAGSYWLAVSPNTNSEPSLSNVLWQQLAGQGAAGPAGAPGATGPAGAPGATGAQGPAGPPGPQGPQGPQGPAGPGTTTGQTSTTVTGTSSGNGMTVDATTTSFTAIPGLTQSFTVPANAVVLFSTDGSAVTQATCTAPNLCYSYVIVLLFVDGVGSPPFFKNLVAANSDTTFYSGTSSWAMTGTLNLPAGSHTVDVRVIWGSGFSSSPAWVGGSLSSSYPSTLTVTVLKQ